MPSSIARGLRNGRARATSIPSTPRRRNTTAAPPPQSTDPQSVAAPVTPRTAPAAGTREDTLRGMPTFRSATTTRAGLVPVRNNERNIHLTPVRTASWDPTNAAATGFDSAFFTEAATGTEADQATTAMRSHLRNFLLAGATGVPLEAYFPSGHGALSKEVDGRSRKHTGLWRPRCRKQSPSRVTKVLYSYRIL